MGLKIGNVAKFGGHVLIERLTGYRASTKTDVAQSADAMTPEWLTLVLCANVPGAAVTSVRVTGGSDGTTSRRAMRVQYNEAGRAANLPTQLFTKCTANFKSRVQGFSINKLAYEVGFYNLLRPKLKIEATEAIYAGCDSATGRTAMIFEDIAATSGAKFLNIFDYVTRPMAESMVETMAQYHAYFWRSDWLAKFEPPLRTVLEYQEVCNESLPYEQKSYVGIERAADVVALEIVRNKERLWQAHMRSLEVSSQEPMTLVHADVHVGNWYMLPNGKMGLTDWNANKGSWATDFSYALVTALTTEDRRAWEKDLLRLYLAHLSSLGVRDCPSFDEAWLSYRQQMFHALFYWTYPLGIGGMQPKMQLPEVSARNVERCAQAVVDLDSMGSVGLGFE